MEQPTRFIGMDVHKDTIVVAIAVAARPARIGGAASGPMRFCYEAGPCGYAIHRTLTRLGEDCMVVAPSMIPRKSGERRKNDKRDAALATLHRGGLLTAIWVARCSA